MEPLNESKVEGIKRASLGLRGGIAAGLRSAAPELSEGDAQLLKFHGVYQGDDRDARLARRATGVDHVPWFMVRIAVPGGRLRAEQYLALDELADRCSWNRSLRLTTRQGIQLHGLAKGDLKPAIQGIHATLLTTLAARGDVRRNVTASAVPLGGLRRRLVHELAARVAAELAPRTGAYHEIWLDGERVAGGPDDEEEPFYGSQYLPRKLKVAVGLPDDPDLDLQAQDVSLVALFDGDRLTGVDVFAGGGLGMTHRKADTFARLAEPLGSLPAERAVDVVREIAAVFRDHGNRADRRHARLKYLLAAWGVARFRAEVERRLGCRFGPWVDLPRPAPPDLLGAHEQGDGRVFYGVAVPSGRIADGPGGRLKSALRRAVESLQPAIVLTGEQDLLLADLAPEAVPRLEAILAAFGVPLPRSLSPLRRHAVACPALPTCGLALTEAERALPELLAGLERELAALGLAGEPLAVRMTGCPNGCARPYTADVGVVGRGIGTYDLYVGGGFAGDRLGWLLAEAVSLAEVAATLRPLLAQWAAGRRPGEGLGDFHARVHHGGAEHRELSGAKAPPSGLVRGD